MYERLSRTTVKVLLESAAELGIVSERSGEGFTAQEVVNTMLMIPDALHEDLVRWAALGMMLEDSGPDTPEGEA